MFLCNYSFLVKSYIYVDNVIEAFESIHFEKAIDSQVMLCPAFQSSGMFTRPISLDLVSLTAKSFTLSVTLSRFFELLETSEISHYEAFDLVIESLITAFIRSSLIVIT